MYRQWVSFLGALLLLFVNDIGRSSTFNCWGLSETSTASESEASASRSRSTVFSLSPAERLLSQTFFQTKKSSSSDSRGSSTSSVIILTPSTGPLSDSAHHQTLTLNPSTTASNALDPRTATASRLTNTAASPSETEISSSSSQPLGETRSVTPTTTGAGTRSALSTQSQTRVSTLSATPTITPRITSSSTYTGTHSPAPTFTIQETPSGGFPKIPTRTVTESSSEFLLATESLPQKDGSTPTKGGVAITKTNAMGNESSSIEKSISRGALAMSRSQQRYPLSVSPSRNSVTKPTDSRKTLSIQRCFIPKTEDDAGGTGGPLFGVMSNSSDSSSKTRTRSVSQSSTTRTGEGHGDEDPALAELGLFALTDQCLNLYPELLVCSDARRKCLRELRSAASTGSTDICSRQEQCVLDSIRCLSRQTLGIKNVIHAGQHPATEDGDDHSSTCQQVPQLRVALLLYYSGAAYNGSSIQLACDNLFCLVRRNESVCSEGVGAQTPCLQPPLPTLTSTPSYPTRTGRTQVPEVSLTEERVSKTLQKHVTATPVVGLPSMPPIPAPPPTPAPSQPTSTMTLQRLFSAALTPTKFKSEGKTEKRASKSIPPSQTVTTTTTLSDSMSLTLSMGITESSMLTGDSDTLSLSSSASVIQPFLIISPSTISSEDLRSGQGGIKRATLDALMATMLGNTSSANDLENSARRRQGEEGEDSARSIIDDHSLDFSRSTGSIIFLNITLRKGVLLSHSGRKTDIPQCFSVVATPRQRSDEFGWNSSNFAWGIGSVVADSNADEAQKEEEGEGNEFLLSISISDEESDKIFLRSPDTLTVHVDKDCVAEKIEVEPGTLTLEPERRREEALSPDAVNAALAVGYVGVAITAGSIPILGLAAARAQAGLTLASCGPLPPPLLWFENPFGVEMGDDPVVAEVAGASVFNWLLIFLLLSLHFVAVLMGAICFSSSQLTPGLLVQMKKFVKFPRAAHLGFMVLLQPTLFASLVALRIGGVGDYWYSLISCILVVVAFLFVLFLITPRGFGAHWEERPQLLFFFSSSVAPASPTSAPASTTETPGALSSPDKNASESTEQQQQQQQLEFRGTKERLYAITFGTHYWRNLSKHPAFVEQNGVFFSLAHSKSHWFIFLELCLSAVIAIAQAARPLNSCDSASLVSIISVSVSLLVQLILRGPFGAPLNSFTWGILTLLSLLQNLVSVLEWEPSVSGVLFLFSVIVIVLRAMFEVMVRLFFCRNQLPLRTLGRGGKEKEERTTGNCEKQLALPLMEAEREEDQVEEMKEVVDPDEDNDNSKDENFSTVLQIPTAYSHPHNRSGTTSLMRVTLFKDDEGSNNDFPTFRPKNPLTDVDDDDEEEEERTLLRQLRFGGPTTSDIKESSRQLGGMSSSGSSDYRFLRSHFPRNSSPDAGGVL